MGLPRESFTFSFSLLKLRTRMETCLREVKGLVQ